MLQMSIDVLNARLDSIEVTVGTSPILRLYTGTVPANCAASATGTVLAEMVLPSDWMDDASGAVVMKLGTWQDLTANNDGTAGWFGIWNSADTIRHIQGSCTDTAGAGPMKLSSTSVVSGEPVTIVTFTITDPND